MKRGSPIKVMQLAASAAGKILMKHYGQISHAKVKSKSRNDYVTFVDKLAQETVIKILRKHYPAYGFRAEEEGMLEKRKYMWHVDPLDGTTNYIHQYPAFCVSIGLAQGDRVLAGLVYDPLHRECFTALKGKGAYLNGARIHVSHGRTAQSPFLATGFPFRWRSYFPAYHESFVKISKHASGIRRGGSAALDLCYAACGRVDGFWEFGLSSWDIAAGILMVKEAGGRVTDFGGKPHCLYAKDIIAGNRQSHQLLARVIRSVPGFFKR